MRNGSVPRTVSSPSLGVNEVFSGRKTLQVRSATEREKPGRYALLRIYSGASLHGIQSFLIETPRQEILPGPLTTLRSFEHRHSLPIQQHLVFYSICHFLHLIILPVLNIPQSTISMRISPVKPRKITISRLNSYRNTIFDTHITPTFFIKNSWHIWFLYYAI